MEELKELFKLLDSIFDNAIIDYEELSRYKIDIDFLEDIQNRRLANSFLFYFSKIQDKIGAKLFKKVLYELGEIETYSIPFIDILNILEKLEILSSKEWLKIREIRNELSHDYPSDIYDSIENLKLSLQYFPKILEIYKNLKAISERVI